jgi:parallel beta-helix repeat protein
MERRRRNSSLRIDPSKRGAARRNSWPLAARAAALAFVALLVACDPQDLDPNSQLIGCESAAERLELTGSSHLDPACVYAGGFEISTSGVTLDCRGALIRPETRTSNRGISIMAPPETELTDVTIRNCRVEGFLNSVRILRDGYKSFARDEEYLHPTSNIVLEKNWFGGSHGVGVYVDAYVSDVIIRNNVITEAGSAGIYLETGSRRNQVEHNLLLDNGFRENGPNGQVFRLSGIDFWFWGVGREGIAIDGSYENTIRHNTFRGNSAGGIFLYKTCGEYPDSPRYFERRYPADANLIEHNFFWGGRNGVWLGSRLAENTFPMECTDDAYVSTPLRRIVPDYAADNVVRRNSFFDVTYGVRVEDDGNEVSGNRFFAPSADYHAVIIGTPDRTDILGEPVTGTVLRNNSSHIKGNANPYRWIHGHEESEVSRNRALGKRVGICEGEPVPRQAIIFVVAVALAGPGGTPPATTPDLTVPTLGELAPCETSSP